MNARHALLAVLVVALGCGESEPAKPGTVSGDAKKLGQDAVKTAKDAGDKVGDGLAKAADSLEAFAKSISSKASESGEALSQSVQSKMPDMEHLVEQTKAKLAAGGEKTKAMVAKLDEKLATLKSKAETLAHNAAAATKEMKDDVVTAFNDLVAEIKTDLA